MGTIKNKPSQGGRRHSSYLLYGSLALWLGVPLVSGQTNEAQPAAQPVTFDGEYYSVPQEADKPSARATNPEEQGNLYNINMVVVVGDRDPVLSLPNWQHYENEALYQPMSEADIESFRQRILKDMQDRGFIFATVSVYKPSLVQGFLKLRVHVGELGKVTVKGNKYHSAEQLLKQVDWTTGESFDYTTLFNRLYAVNTNPGVQITSQFKPRQEEGGRRVIDAEFTVKERFPVSAGLTISNDGFTEGGEWRSKLAVQWFNPFKQDDTLGVEWSTSLARIDKINAVNASYVIPVGEKTQVSAFAGFSESDLPNVLPQLDLVGKGYFFGVGLHQNLYESDKSVLDGSVGWTFMNSENTTNLGGENVSHYQVNYSMPRFSLTWSAKDYDSWGGRNFFTNTIMFNIKGTFGASDEADYLLVNPRASGTFIIDRFQFARFQKLWGSPTETGSFSLFTRFDAQVASQSLPPALYKTVGGADSVRGYKENTTGGDMGYEFSMELRTPLIANFIKPWQRSEEYLKENPDFWGVHRLQALVFFDAATVADIQEAPSGTRGGTLYGTKNHVDLYSVGLGLRMTVTKYSQFKLDYGYPLTNGPGIPVQGRIHFSGQLQF